MQRDRPTLELRHAVALGLAQGPTELLPISSSAHTVLIAFFAGWPYAELDPQLRKSFEVALHTGAGLALAIDMRRQLVGELRSLDRTRAAVAALSLGPPALAGYVLARPLERRLGGPRSIAAGLAAGAVAMALADARPARSTRRRGDARARDGLALGLAQALALAPGVSRSGATLTAARARGFRRRDAQALSRHAALPVILGASALTGVRMARRGSARGAGRALLAGATGSFISTLASARLLGRGAHDERSLLPYAVYRCAVAALVLRRLRGGTGASALRAQ